MAPTATGEVVVVVVVVVVLVVLVVSVVVVEQCLSSSNGECGPYGDR